MILKIDMLMIITHVCFNFSNIDMLILLEKFGQV